MTESILRDNEIWGRSVSHGKSRVVRVDCDGKYVIIELQIGNVGKPYSVRVPRGELIKKLKIAPAELKS